MLIVPITLLLSLPATLCLPQELKSTADPIAYCTRYSRQQASHPEPISLINPKDAAELVRIPAGEFLMGDKDFPSNPPHKVLLSTFTIYKHLVTVKQYKEFCRQTGHSMPSDPYYDDGWKKEANPICDVSWKDAVAYAKWAGGVLPSEAQWEKAARGTDGRTYPWGNDFDPSKLWSRSKERVTGTAPVGQYATSPYGLSDMAGNVWQWCRDGYDEHFWTRKRTWKDPVNPILKRLKIPKGYKGLADGVLGSHVLKGGDWRSGEERYFRCATRYQVPDWDYLSCGFRVVIQEKPVK